MVTHVGQYGTLQKKNTLSLKQRLLLHKLKVVKRDLFMLRAQQFHVVHVLCMGYTSV